MAKKPVTEVKIGNMTITETTTVRELNKQIEILKETEKKLSGKSKDVIKNRKEKFENRKNKYIASFKTNASDRSKLNAIFANDKKKKEYQNAVRDSYSGVSIDVINKLFGSKNKPELEEPVDKKQEFIDFIDKKKILHPSSIAKIAAVGLGTIGLGVGGAALIATGAITGVTALGAVGLVAGVPLAAALVSVPIFFKPEIKRAWNQYTANHKANIKEESTKTQIEAEEELKTSQPGDALDEFNTAYGGKNPSTGKVNITDANEKNVYNTFVRLYDRAVSDVIYGTNTMFGDASKSVSERFEDKINALINKVDGGFVHDPIKREELKTLFSEMKEFIKELDEKTKGMKIRERKAKVQEMKEDARLVEDADPTKSRLEELS